MDIRPPSLPSVKIPQNKNDEKPEATREAKTDSPLFSLNEAVKNNEASEATLSRMSDAAQVQKANEEASASDIRDVEKAAALANKLSRKIESNPEQAVSAQANQKPEDVQRLLS